MIYKRENINDNVIMSVAQKMCTAAITAPKGHGIDNINVLILDGEGVRTFSWTAYAVNPRDRLYSTGLRYPNDFLILFSLYQRRYRSNSCENSSMVTSCQS